MIRPPRAPGAHMRALLLIVGVSTVIRTLAALVVPVLDDEAFYWVWSKHLMWGYPDHPPMIAAVVAAGTHLAGDSVIGIRLMPVLLGTASTLLLYALTRRLFSPAAGLRAALLSQVIPAFAAAGIMAAPDAPLGLFWPVGMLLGWMAVQGKRWAWPAAGAVVGLAVQSKLPGTLLAVSLAGYVLTSRSRGVWLRAPGPYLAVAAGALVIAPLVWWNAAHNWLTVTHLSVLEPWITPRNAAVNLAAFLAAQFAFYAPLGFPILFAGLVAIVRRARADERFRYLLWCAMPLLLVVLVNAAGAMAKPHHTGPALLCGLIAAAGLWPLWGRARLLRAAIVTSAVLMVVAVGMAAVPNSVLGEFHRDSRGWSNVADEVDRMIVALGPPGQTFVLAETYQTGGQLAFAMRDRVPVIVPRTAFDLWQPPARWVNRNGVVMNHPAGERFVVESGAFARLGTPHIVSLGAGRDVRLYPGLRYRGITPWPERRGSRRR